MGKKYCRIFIKKADSIYDFLWADVGPDWTVYFGASYCTRQKTHVVLDKNIIFRPKDFISGKSLDNPKISFHSTGHYKTSTIIGLTKESLDRCTVIGPPLNFIKKPRRMMEILLPSKLNPTRKEQRKRDITLDATEFCNRPLRCTIWCADLSNFHKWAENPTKIVDTSIIEYSKAIEDGKRVWVFTLRQNEKDVNSDNELIIYIHGKIKWGTIRNAI